jgi:hypothetical protein
MKKMKILGLLVVAAATLMAFAGIASATTLTTSTDGGITHHQVPLNTVIRAVNEGKLALDTTVKVDCTGSTVEGKVTNEGGASATAQISITALTFEACNHTVTVLHSGIREIHTESASSNGNGTLTSSGVEITVLTHGIVGTVHCLYTTNNTDIGRVTGSDNTGSTATLDIDSAPIIIDETSFGCGFGTAEWTGLYKFDSPDHLDVD